MPYMRERDGGWQACLAVNGDKKWVWISREDLDDSEHDTPEAWADAEFDAWKAERERERLGLPGRMALSRLFDHFEDQHLPGLAENTQKVAISARDW